jgi:hypothetical protein
MKIVRIWGETWRITERGMNDLRLLADLGPLQGSSVTS